MLALQVNDRSQAVHLRKYCENTLVAYAQLRVDDGVAGAELAVDPHRRRQGHGRELIANLIDTGVERGATTLRIWAHGDLPSAAACAISLGFDRDRVLWQLRKPLNDGIDEPTMPPGVRLRAFLPGHDEAALLAVNNAAFADHPEQGRWTLSDVTARQRQEWFDPAGLLLAERESDGHLLGFHWTKVHRHDDEPIGEVYVVGVSPAAQGMGLGAALTAAGLRHLRDHGLARVLLYVDESNTAAMRMYRNAGFTEFRADVQYRRDL